MTTPRMWRTSLQLIFAFTLLLAAPASAQDWSRPWADPYDRPARVDLSVSVGLLAPTDWSDLVLLGSISPRSGVLEQVLVRDLRVDADRDFGAGVTYWRGRYGFRAHGGLSSSSLIMGAPLPGAFSASPPDELQAIDVDTWTYNIGGAIGLLEYSPRRWFWPYAFVGVGGITYDLARRVSPPLLMFIDRPPTRPDGRDIVVDDNTRNFLLAVDELDNETVFAVNGGIGTDFRIPLGPAGLGVRLEISDHIAASPVGLRVGELRRSGALASDTGVRFGFVHHLRASAGFVVHIGR